MVVVSSTHGGMVMHQEGLLGYYPYW